MGLLEKLKSALGLDGARSSEASPSSDVDVTVEREPSTEAEDAVKGTETSLTDEVTDDGPGVEEAEPEPDEAGAESEPAPDEMDSGAEPAADDTESAADTDSEADAAETAEPDAAEADSDDSEPEQTVEDAEADSEADGDTEPAAVEGSSDPVTELNGIGPAYAERLHGLDIETVGELAVADAADIADQTDLGEKRVADWIDQAEAY